VTFLYALQHSYAGRLESELLNTSFY